MKKLIFIVVALLINLCACSKSDEPEPDGPTRRTLFVYMPWSSDLLSYFYTNLNEIESAVKKGILKNERIIVYLHTSPTESEMFEIVYNKGNCERVPVKNYENAAFTTAEGISSILRDMVAEAPAAGYAMMVGCHGMGWIPVGADLSRASAEKEYWEYEGVPKTRWFGGFTSAYQTDVTTLAKAISDAGLKFEYILFDDCFMSSTEASFELRNVADHIIACPTEIMIRGMPYDIMVPYLTGEIDYGKATDAFVEFYSTYSTPCGTIGVTVCSELDNLAAVMKKINSAFVFDDKRLNNIQRMDGYSPVRFFDLYDYVKNLCGDEILLHEFETQLHKTFPPAYCKHTEYYYSQRAGKIYINTYTGSTISDPSVSKATAAKTGTAWYAATH